jgi:hypothetical protein
MTRVLRFSSLAAMAVGLALAQGGCHDEIEGAIYGPPGPRSNDADKTIEGPDQVTAGEPATFVIDGLGTASGHCPEVLNWHFEVQEQRGDPAVLGPATRSTTDGRCVLSSASVTHTFPAGERGTSRMIHMAAEVSANVVEYRVVSKSVVVKTPTTSVPIARFFAGVEPLVDGKAASFDGRISSDADGSITSYAWRVDGGNPTGSDPVLTAQLSPGLHTIELTVTDDSGLADTKSTAYAVQPASYPLYAGFSVSPVSGTAGQDVTVTPEPRPQNP